MKLPVSCQVFWADAVTLNISLHLRTAFVNSEEICQQCIYER